jgi:membrane protease YdiL (CAAX protease family)
VLFIFLLTEDVVELLIFSQYDVITAREIWASKIKIDRPGLNLDFQLVFGLLVACFATPLAEEIFFRALLFEALRLHFKTWVSVLFLAALFVAAHPQNPYVIGTLIFSITLSMVYLKLNSLWPCIIAHGFFNFLSFAYDNFSEIFLTPVLEEAYLISNWKLTLFLFFVSTSILVWIFCFSCRSHNRNNSAI